MEDTKINFRTKTWIKEEFFKICKDQNINASARFNDFMRSVINESGSKTSSTNRRDGKAFENWRDDLVRG